MRAPPRLRSYFFTAANHHRDKVPNSKPQPPERSEEHTSELQSQSNLVCRLLLEKKKIAPVPQRIRSLIPPTDAHLDRLIRNPPAHRGVPHLLHRRFQPYFVSTPAVYL